LLFCFVDQATALMNACRAVFSHDITPATACNLLVCEEALGDGRVMEYIMEHAAAVLESKSFTSTSFKQVSTIANSNSLNIDEVHLFCALWNWAACECERQGKSVTAENRRTVLGPILYVIRFPTMSLTDLAIHVAPTQIFSSSELADIYQNVMNCDERATSLYPNDVRTPGKGLLFTFYSALRAGWDDVIFTHGYRCVRRLTGRAIALRSEQSVDSHSGMIMWTFSVRSPSSFDPSGIEMGLATDSFRVSKALSKSAACAFNPCSLSPTIALKELTVKFLLCPHNTMLQVRISALDADSAVVSPDVLAPASQVSYEAFSGHKLYAALYVDDSVSEDVVITMKNTATLAVAPPGF
jgi:BTB And C-terminal Kelch